MYKRDYDIISYDNKVIIKEYDHILHYLRKAQNVKDAVDVVSPYAYFLNNRFKYVIDMTPLVLTEELKKIGEIQSIFHSMFNKNLNRILTKMNLDIEQYAKVVDIVYKSYVRYFSLKLKGNVSKEDKL